MHRCQPGFSAKLAQGRASIGQSRVSAMPIAEQQLNQFCETMEEAGY